MDQSRRTSHQDTEPEKRRDRELDIKKLKVLKVLFVFLFLLLFLWIPFDGAEQSGASLIVERDDDARGRKVRVIVQGRTPAGRDINVSFIIYFFKTTLYVSTLPLLRKLKNLNVKKHNISLNICSCVNTFCHKGQ